MATYTNNVYEALQSTFLLIHRQTRSNYIDLYNYRNSFQNQQQQLESRQLKSPNNS